MLIQKNTFILVVILWVLVSQVSADEFVKKPNVAFKFYAGEPKKLNEHLDRLFATANVKPYKHHADIVIAPHAGYIYSGSVTAHAFKAVQSNNYETVIILAPSHYYPTDTVSVWAQGGFKTPLGMAAIDEEMAMRILAIDERITFDASVYDKEHSVEVEIPFIQKTFPKAKIVPMIMGGIDFSLMVKVAKGLREIIGDRQDVLIVVSSDMSHYFDDVTARKLDGNAIRTIQKYDIEGIIRNNNKTLAIDGVVPVLTAMLYAKDKGLKYIDKIKYAHSGHVSGDMNRVVGYAGIVFHNKEVIKEKVNFGEVGELTKKQKKKLLSVAEKSVKKYVVRGSKLKVRERDARLKKIGNGVFVTLYKEGELRGCMGHVTGSKPLSELVRNMAIA
ncbi:MAG: AmmeMemoRadiSam system protein B, partial [Lysobacterales bacterium]